MITSLDKFITATELQESGKLSAGDVVEIDRVIYSHWVLYVGGGHVVHVTGRDSDIPGSDAFVDKRSLLDVARGSLVRVNNKLVPAKERRLASLPCDVTVKTALAIVGEKVEHNLMTKNSEHFVTKWKYGTAWSDQADAAYHGVFSSSPQTDPQKAHNTMLTSLKSLLHSAQHSEEKENDHSTVPAPKIRRSNSPRCKSKSPKVLLSQSQ